ncbi:hypothetical protein BESB_036360 [Besnoitia besnoiti]|uniref:Transmembrane protein n=1 Tax=Besnoitia besnoiti TaxID=94643 RepID=A0A2A9MF89_BESBE|nr:hypothetical protein BESB_036360 [Besnoitia besnoiti]PFH37178.1 hypothetical protein BESB_036360 [Besnoitia besnoiti]
MKRVNPTSVLTASAVVGIVCLCAALRVFEDSALSVAAEEAKGVEVGGLSFVMDETAQLTEDASVGDDGVPTVRGSTTAVRPRKQGKHDKVRFSLMSWSSMKRSDRPLARNRVRKYFLDLLPVFAFVAFAAALQFHRRRLTHDATSTPAADDVSPRRRSMDETAVGELAGTVEDIVNGSDTEQGDSDQRITGRLPTYEESHLDEHVPDERWRVSASWGAPPPYTP